MRIALLGTDGIPARYGGFETFVEQIALPLTALGHEVLVVGSSIGRPKSIDKQPSLRIVNLPLRANGASSIVFDLLSFFRVFWWADAIVLLGVSAGVFAPVFRLFTRRSRLVINVDGLESRRQKWRGLRGGFLAFSEACAVRFAARVVADNKGIADILMQRYGRSSTVIAYGADHVLLPDPREAERTIVESFKLEPRNYALTIARIEPENHVDLMIEGFLRSAVDRYVIVGNFKNSEYGRRLFQLYGEHQRVTLIESVYDPLLLASLRSQCCVYLHGHSVGGTNPSLVEILPYQRAIFAWDCDFNRHTLEQSGSYFDSVESLTSLLDAGNFQRSVPPLSVRSALAYRWEVIAESYSKLIQSIAS
jgi:glycosyltransferase involved in cell wall biosynthesis